MTVNIIKRIKIGPFCCREFEFIIITPVHVVCKYILAFTFLKKASDRSL